MTLLTLDHAEELLRHQNPKELTGQLHIAAEALRRARAKSGSEGAKGDLLHELRALMNRPDAGSGAGISTP